MTYLLEVETPESKKAFTEEFLMTLPFVKNVQPFTGKKPARPRFYQEIEDYKNGVINPSSSLSLRDLEALAEIYAEELTPPKEMTYEERRKQIDEIFDKYPLDLSNFKFNRDEANNYD
jgi:hypothetical protein